MLFIFSTPVLIGHLWQLETVVFLQWCLICAVLLGPLCCVVIMSVASAIDNLSAVYASAECNNLAHYAESRGAPMSLSREH